jgi:DMSO/TMAO reductase YedYZ heme-binding membrane subunit
MARRWPLVLGIIAGFLALSLGLAMGGDAAQAWGRAARWTARIGLPIFLIAYLASSLRRLWPGDLTRALWRDRRWWGLGFAACHTVHLYALVRALEASGEVPTIGTLIPGGLAYAMIFAMALTSNDAAMRALGKNWKRLHKAGIHYVWLVFTLAYAGRLADPATVPEAIYGTGLCLAAGAIRFAAWRKGRQPRSQLV